MATLISQREEDGSIPTANPTGLSPINVDVVFALGSIGDGAFGTTSGDFDFYRVDAVAGSFITVRTVGQVFGLDPEVRIYDAGGTRLALSDNFDNLDSFAQLAVAVTGPYFVAVSSFKSGNPDPTNPFIPGSGVGGPDVQPPLTYRIFINNDSIAETPTAGDDTINGNGQANLLVGGGGADLIDGMGGDDVIEGGTGADAMFGGGANDRFIWRNGDGSDTVAGGSGTDRQDVFLSGNSDAFTVSASGPAAIFTRTSAGPFTISTVDVERLDVFSLGGGDTATINNLAGTALASGQITLRMGGGNDIVLGDASVTSLIIDGGTGDDTLRGGAADDTFIYAPGYGADTIINFTAGTANPTIDQIDLTAFATIQSFADVLARSTQVGANTVIDFGGGDTLTLQNVQKSSLFAPDFGFPAWLKSPIELAEFGWAQGWTSPDYLRVLEDIDQNAGASLDYIGFGASQVTLAVGGTWNDGSGLGSGFRKLPGSTLVNDFTPAQGYDQTFARGVDFVGNFGTSADAIWGQGNAGIIYYVPTGGTSVLDDAGQSHFIPQYDQASRLYREFGHDQGWNTHFNFDIVFASNADSFASVLGFGADGLRVARQAFAPTADASQSYIATGTASIGNVSGWDSERDIRTFTDEFDNRIDLNADGVVDFVGLGPNGLQYATGVIDAGGNFQLNALQTAHINGASSDFGDAQGWNNSNTIRYIADLNGDGRQDIIGFGAVGALVSLGQDPLTHGGEAFGQIYLGIADFGFSQGWLSPTDLPRVIGDVNGDDVLDIVGFGNSATFTALGSKDVNGTVTWAVDPTLTINDYGNDQGWNLLPTVRDLADVDGDGRAELVLSGAAGTHTWDLV